MMPMDYVFSRFPRLVHHLLRDARLLAGVVRLLLLRRRRLVLRTQLSSRPDKAHREQRQQAGPDNSLHGSYLL